MAGSILAAVEFIARRRPDRTILITGFLTGIILTLVNMTVEWAGARADIYYVIGPFPVVRTPLPLLIAWVFLAFLFCAWYSLIFRRPRPVLRPWLYVSTGIAAGWGMDFTGWKVLGLLRLGDRGHPLILAVIWAVLIPLTIVVYRGILRVMR